MTEREAIESTYFDTTSIYRREAVKDDETRQAKQCELLVAGNIRCALSRNKSGVFSSADGYGKTSGSYTLFCSPEAPISAGDRVEVTTQAGQKFALWAGKPFVYASHAEVPLSSEEERA